MIQIYGVLDSEGIHHDISGSILAAKRYATVNGFNKVSVRHGYNAFIIAEKIGGKWKNIKEV